MRQGQERLFSGGRVYTGNPLQPVADAVAVRGSEIVAIGDRNFCLRSLSNKYEERLLRGATLLPGFIDTHTHPTLMLYYEMYADLKGVRGKEGLLESLQHELAVLPAGQWLLGFRLDLDRYAGGLLDATALDEVARTTPAVVVMHNGHMLVANHKAMALAGIDGETQDPPGGSLDRGSDGKLTGVFREAAMNLILAALPKPQLKMLRRSADAVIRNIVAAGITGIGAIMQLDGEGPAGAKGIYDMSLMLGLFAKAPFAIYPIYVAESSERLSLTKHTPWPAKAYKLFCDGTLGSCTACMQEPFTDQPGVKGYLVHDEAWLWQRMVAGHLQGLQLAIHAIGDEAIRLCVELYDRLLKQYPRANHRHRLEHASLVPEELMPAIKRLGLVLAVQPLFIESERSWLAKRLGDKRVAKAYPFRSFSEHGISLCGSSDAPVEELSVLKAVQCAVTRGGFQPQQALDVAAAFKLYGSGAAYAQFEEGRKGSLMPGMQADFVILAEDPFTVPMEQIGQIEVLETVISGVSVYQAAQGILVDLATPWGTWGQMMQYSASQLWMRIKGH